MLKLFYLYFFTMKQHKICYFTSYDGYGTYYYFYFNYIKNNNQDIYKYI